MGDHRFSFKAEMTFHGIKDVIELGWNNWDAGTDGIDSRITQFIKSVRDRGYAKYDAEVSAYHADHNKITTERAERAEYDRLRAKFDPEKKDN